MTSSCLVSSKPEVVASHHVMERNMTYILLKNVASFVYFRSFQMVSVEQE